MQGWIGRMVAVCTVVCVVLVTALSVAASFMELVVVDQVMSAVHAFACLGVLASSVWIRTTGAVDTEGGDAKVAAGQRIARMVTSGKDRATSLAARLEQVQRLNGGGGQASWMGSVAVSGSIREAIAGTRNRP